MNEKNKKDKKLWEAEDWDKVSCIHKKHREILGYPLTKEVVICYVSVVILTIFAKIIFNF
ncbi:hypothetical protein [Ureibacillus thermosphaericus]|uniref:hypothetical protein n=1 Tax=Ureibacillus thermosphaericus TaxID=51173 RepID=UPI000BBB91EA|nr:hypothetical protein [Ureibacillus thermosphaericus]